MGRQLRRSRGETKVMDMNDNEPVTGGKPFRDEARLLLSTTIRRLRSSRCRLEMQPDQAHGDDDAAVYIATAEMHLQAALFRLEDEINAKPSSF